MSIRTQIRLEQITGSVVDIAPNSLSRGTPKELVEHQSLGDILKYYSQAITNIHGHLDFGSAEVSTFLGDAAGVNKFGNDGTGLAALHLTASASGITLSARIPEQDIVVKVKDSSGDDQTAYSVIGATRSLRMSGSNALEFRDENNKIEWSVGQLLLSSSEVMRVSAQSIALGATDIKFLTDVPFDYDQDSLVDDLMFFANPGEVSTFQQKFNNSTTVIGAFNNLRQDLNDVMSTARSTIFTTLIVDPVLSGESVTLAHYSGDSQFFGSVLQPFEAEVFVNGQLMFSGSSLDVDSGLADYHVSSQNQLKFGFSLEVDDRVTLIDRSIATNA